MKFFNKILIILVIISVSLCYIFCSDADNKTIVKQDLDKIDSTVSVDIVNKGKIVAPKILNSIKNKQEYKFTNYKDTEKCVDITYIFNASARVNLKTAKYWEQNVPHLVNEKVINNVTEEKICFNYELFENNQTIKCTDEGYDRIYFYNSYNIVNKNIYFNYTYEDITFKKVIKYYDDWVELNSVTKKVKDKKIFVFENISINSNEELKIVPEIKLDVFLGQNKGEYDIMMSPCSVESFEEKKQSDEKVYLDPWYDTSYKYCRPVNVTNPSESETLTDYPFLLKLNASGDFTLAQSDGDDIIIVNGTSCNAGGNVLPHELETWVHDDNSTLSAVWYKDTMTADETKTILVYYGNSTTGSNEDVANVWNSDYRSVFHLSDLSDSTTNGFDLQAFNSPTLTTSGCRVGNCYDFEEGNSEYMRSELAGDGMVGDSFAIEIFGNSEELGDYDRLITFGSNSTYASHQLYAASTSFKMRSYNGDASASSENLVESVNPGTNVWRFYGTSIDSDSHINSFLYNSTDYGSDTTFSKDISGATEFHLSRLVYSGNYYNFWDGKIDEARISTTERSVEWLNATYKIVAGNSNYVIVNAEEEYGGGGGGDETPTIYLENPEDNNKTIDTTPTFYFNSTVGCDATLYINSTPYGDLTISHNISSSITANASLDFGEYSWYISCINGTETNVSVNRTIGIYICNIPPVPTSLATNGIDNESIYIDWDDMADTEKYIVYQNESNLANATNSYYNSTKLTNNTFYSYMVAGFNSSCITQLSANSTPITAQTEQNSPGFHVNDIYVLPTHPNSWDNLSCYFNVTYDSLFNASVTWFMANDDGNYVNVDTYNNNFYNLSSEVLYYTEPVNGSVLAPLTNYTNWKCSINITSSIDSDKENSTAVNVYPLENFNIYSPPDDYMTNEMLNVSFNVTDKSGGLECYLIINNSNYTTITENYVDGLTINDYDDYGDNPSNPTNLYDSNLSTYSNFNSGGNDKHIYNVTKAIKSNTMNYIELTFQVKDTNLGCPFCTIMSYKCGNDSDDKYSRTPTIASNYDYNAGNPYNFTFRINKTEYPLCLNRSSDSFIIIPDTSSPYGGGWIYELVNYTMEYDLASIIYDVESMAISDINYTPTSDGDYKYQIACTSPGYDGYAKTEERTFTYDTTSPTFADFSDNSSATYPEIDDPIALDVNVSDNFEIDACELYINDSGSYELKDTYPINIYNNYYLEMEYIVQPVSLANNSNIGWYVRCNDTAGNFANSTVHSFDVVDLTNPEIIIHSGNFFDESNKTVISGYLYNGSLNIEYKDLNLFQGLLNITCDINGSIYYWEELDFNQTSYNLTETVDLTGLELQKCDAFIAVSDDHTAQKIGKYKETKKDKGIEFLTDRNIKVGINSKTLIDNIKTDRLKDRVSFNFKHKNKAMYQEYEIVTDSKNEIYIQKNTGYPGHAVIWDPVKKTGQWIDFKEKTDKKLQYYTEQTEKNKYKVIIQPVVPENEILLKDKNSRLKNGRWDKIDKKTIKNYNNLLDKYGINDFTFESVGGTNTLNETYSFYIGGALNVSSLNIYDNSTFTNFTVNITTINSYPGFNGSIFVNDSSHRWLDNLTNGTYEFTINHPEYFSFIYDVLVENISQELEYRTYQSILNFEARELRDNTVVSDFNVTINNTDTGTETFYATDGGTVATFYVNAGNYSYLYEHENYVNLTGTTDVIYKENKTIISYLYFVATFNIYDERTLDLFNMTRTDEVKFKMYCPNQTIEYTLNESTSEIPFVCDYEYVRFFVYYTLVDGAFNYYRSLIVEPDPAGGFNYSVYLIDMTDTSYVVNSFIIDDLLGEYENVSIYVKKRIPSETVDITADFVDINDKITAYLIENEEYIIEVHSINKPIKVMGRYIAATSGDKSLRLYDINIDTTGNSFANDVSYGATAQNQSGNLTYVAYYEDLNDLTDEITFYVWKDEYNGTVLAAHTVTGNFSNGVLYEYDMQAYENDTIYGGIRIEHPYGEFDYVKLVNEITEIALDILEYVSQNAVNWFLLLFLGGLAIMSTIRSANKISLALIGMASMFVLFGWLTLSTSILGLSLIFSLLSNMKEPPGGKF